MTPTITRDAARTRSLHALQALSRELELAFATARAEADRQSIAASLTIVRQEIQRRMTMQPRF